jgi:hypothetical protein
LKSNKLLGGLRDFVVLDEGSVDVQPNGTKQLADGLYFSIQCGTHWLMSLTITAIRNPWSGDWRMCLRRVVLPLPYTGVSVSWRWLNVDPIDVISYQKPRKQGDRHLPCLGLLLRRSWDMIRDCAFSRVDDHNERWATFVYMYTKQERRRRRRKII